MAVALLTMIPLMPPLVSTPAIEPPEPSMVSDLVIVTVPKPPGSSTLMNPPTAVLLIAPANVLHGAVRLHGFSSAPTPETHVRVACANARELPSSMQPAKDTAVRTERNFIDPPERRSRDSEEANGPV